MMPVDHLAPWTQNQRKPSMDIHLSVKTAPTWFSHNACGSYTGNSMSTFDTNDILLASGLRWARGNHRTKTQPLFFFDFSLFRFFLLALLSFFSCSLFARSVVSLAESFWLLSRGIILF